MYLNISLLGNKRWWSLVFLEGSLNFHALIKEGLLSLKWRHKQKATQSKSQMISSLLGQKQTLKMTDNRWFSIIRKNKRSRRITKQALKHLTAVIKDEMVFVQNRILKTAGFLSLLSLLIECIWILDWYELKKKWEKHARFRFYWWWLHYYL